MPLITAAQLARVAPHAAAHIVAAIVDHADDVLPRYGLATAARLPDFLAHVLVESAYLTRLSEDLDYTAARLVQVWPSRFKTVMAAAPYAHQPEKLADLVYGGRMGNTGPDDGWLNRGQGLLEETGHDNLQALALHMRVGLEAARAALTSDAGMLEAAAAVYVMLGAPAYADRGDIVGTTRCVNGGTNGLADRRGCAAGPAEVHGFFAEEGDVEGAVYGGGGLGEGLGGRREGEGGGGERGGEKVATVHWGSRGDGAF